MNPTFLQYRKTASVGVAFVRGSASLDQLSVQVAASIDSLSAWCDANDATLVVLREWSRLVGQCERQELSLQQLAHWIVYQDVGIPGAANIRT